MREQSKTHKTTKPSHRTTKQLTKNITPNHNPTMPAPLSSV